MIWYDYWKNRFDRDPDVVGQTVLVNGQPLTIVGVGPDRFQGTTLGLQYGLWVPATMAPVLLVGSRELEDRNQRGYSLMGEMRPDATEVAGANRGHVGDERAGEGLPSDRTDRSGARSWRSAARREGRSG